MAEKIILGFSGGTDSFVSALLLKKKYEVVAVTLDLWDFNSSGIIDEAKKLAKEIGIEHHVIEAKTFFETKVVKPFVRDYLAAKTPSPCSVCNNNVKFQLLSGIANKMGIEKIATGHYVSIFKNTVNDDFYIKKGVDSVKDQSYFLWELSQDILKRLILPLGSYTKSEVRQIAIDKGFKKMSTKKESMSVCFLKGRGYVDFINQYLEENPSFKKEVNYKNLSLKGRVFNSKGDIIGEHTGLLNYTIGQKKGINFFNGELGLYVKKMSSSSNDIFVAIKKDLNVLDFEIIDYNFINIKDASSSAITCIVRGLGLNPSGYANLQIVDDKHLMVHLTNPAWAMAPGQPVVFYIGDILIGGGIAN
ncbi:MAG: tRNA 2-thiouridine(34) synthase MnmA [Marinifilaceae bacterium]|jgi:tRNA-specific 2-thiouridylase|nr:tRNA 2-thiouridine(34) synthase MnmA [Marinifilaceae bacterium]